MSDLSQRGVGAETGTSEPGGPMTAPSLRDGTCQFAPAAASQLSKGENRNDDLTGVLGELKMIIHEGSRTVPGVMPSKAL